MKRRDVLAGAGALALTGCAAGEQECRDGTGPAGQGFAWKLVTTWPPKFPGVGTGVERFARQVEAASAGRLRIKVFAGGELVPPLEVFDTVSSGAAEMGHGASYYWKGKAPALQFFTALPFAMNAMEMNAWMYYGGGLELYREAYERFDLVPFPAGNTGVQMGGWFNKEINSLDDLKGLKMRIPGWGGEVLERAGGTPVRLPAAEIFTALQTGTIDATEWIGPYNDRSLGLHQAARYYYYPGWHEPGPVLECIVNRQAYASLPEDLQTIIQIASSALNDQMTAEYTAKNAQALEVLRAEGNIELRRFPDEVLRGLRELNRQVVEELVAEDEFAARVNDSFQRFRKMVAAWTEISEQALLETRAL